MRPRTDELSANWTAQSAARSAACATQLAPVCSHCRKPLNAADAAESERLAAWQNASCTDCAISAAQRDPEPVYLFDRGVMLA